MHLSLLGGLIQRNFVNEGLEGGHELLIQGGDEIVVFGLLDILREDVPGKIVNIPSVIQADVREDKGDCSLRFGESSDKEIGPERDGSSDSSSSMDDGMFTKDYHFARCRNHKDRGHWRRLFSHLK